MNSGVSIVKGSYYISWGNQKVDEFIDVKSGDFLLEKRNPVCLAKA